MAVKQTPNGLFVGLIVEDEPKPVVEENHDEEPAAEPAEKRGPGRPKKNP